MLHLLTLGLHEGPHPYDGRCVSPGQCTPPPAKYSKVIAGPQPGQQWNINGGFCGDFVGFAASASAALSSMEERKQTTVVTTRLT